MANLIHKSLSNMALYTMRASSQTSSTASVKSGIAGTHATEKNVCAFENQKQCQLMATKQTQNDMAPIKRWFAETPAEEPWNHIARTQQDLAALRLKVVRVKL